MKIKYFDKLKSEVLLGKYDQIVYIERKIQKGDIQEDKEISLKNFDKKTFNKLDHIKVS